MSNQDDDLDLPDLSAEGTDPEGGAAPADEAETETEDVDAAAESVDQTRTATDLEAVFDVPVNVSAVLGKAHMEVSNLLKLGRGAVVELDRKVGEAIDIYVNDRLVARGEVVIVEERLGVTMTEIIKSEAS